MNTRMKHNTQHSLAIVLRLAMTLITLFTTLQIASAQGSPADASLTTAETLAPSSSNALDNAPGVRFVHVARGDNLGGDTTYIDHPLTNNNPNAIVFVTQNWNPGGVGGTYNDHPIGVWYNSSQGKWGILNEDQANMTEGMAFNVLIPEPGPNVFVHEATEGWDHTVIDHPLTNSNPDAVLLVTQNWNPGGGTGVYNPYPIGVYYEPGGTPEYQRWWIYKNYNYGALPLGAAFNVMVLDAGPNAFVYHTMDGITIDYYTYIDHPLTNDNPNALLLVTYGGWGSRNFGVKYDSTVGRWAIFLENPDFPMSHYAPLYDYFYVFIPVTNPAFFVHKATAGNITAFYTYIDHPLTNGNPNAILFVTQNWNPGGGAGIYNDHVIGVGYDTDTGKWAILNQDHAAMPEGAAFNVLIPNADTGVFVHQANSINTVLSVITLIDYPLTNDRPDIIVFVTQNWNPGGVGGTYNDQTVGVWYRGSAEHTWAIFNQGLTETLEYAAFNVYIPIPDSTIFVHEATAGNTASNHTCIDHPLTNGNPNALIHVTHNFSPDGVPSSFHDHAIGVFYRTDGKWCIFNQDYAPMPVGVYFNVIVGKSMVYLPLVMR